MSTDVFAGNVPTFERHVQAFNSWNFIADVEVKLEVLFHVHWVTRVASASVVQVLIAPVVSQTSLQTIVFVHQHQVSSVTQTQQRKLTNRRIFIVFVLHITSNQGVVSQDAKAGVAKEVLNSQLRTIQLRLSIVD